MEPKLLLCDCGGTQTLDREGIAAATGLNCSRIHTALCTSQIDLAAKAISEDAEAGVVVACAQEARTFEALAEEIGADTPATIDIRDRAGWSDEGKKATPKIAALLAAARRGRAPDKTMDLVSEGICLILGASETVLPVAEQLADALSVTCLLTDAPELYPAPERRFDVVHGRLKSATGSFGAFRVTLDGFSEASPVGRGPQNWSDPRDGAASDCDLILDLSGGTALFPAHEKRDGYLRADPGDPRAVWRAAMDAQGMVGTFEKTLHVALDTSLCAHSRAEQTGCTRCLDLCPTGAITPDGDHVAIDPNICAGCGACSAVCPSGAVSFDAPTVIDIMTETRVMAEAFVAAGGTAPRLLVHDSDHGREMIGLAARLGRGLPADVLPLDLPSVAAFGHAEAMAALTTGFAGVSILISPKTERDVVEKQVELTQALLAGVGSDTGRVAMLDVADPDALSDALYGPRPKAPATEPILTMGHRRDVTRLATRALATEAIDPIPLPDGAPYGAVLVDTDSCTLCLACVGLCPSGALDDNADKPELRFREDACLQCGLCANVCPEDAITLKPQLDISDNALKLQVLNSEEPFECIECGVPFGVRSTIEKIVEKLEGKHYMFTNSDNTKLIQMCDNCRVQAQYHAGSAPFQMGDRPPVRTTDDYLGDDTDKT